MPSRRIPSRFDRAVAVTRRSLALALVPAVATFLSGTKLARALDAGPGGGVTFPFPAGLPTLWTYVSLPGAPGVGSVGGPLSLVAFVPVFVFGLLVTSALEAGFLGALARRIDDRPSAVLEDVTQFTLRLVGVNVVRIAIVFAVFPLLVVPPLAFGVVLVLSYLVYGLPFEIVARDRAFLAALEATVSHALDAGSYAAFGLAHLVAGALASAFLTTFVRGGGLPAVLVGTALVAVPAVFVAVYGLLVFRDLEPDGLHDRQRI